MSIFSFNLEASDGLARAGTIQTPHGQIETPIFMPVGTAASVKSLAPDDLLAANSQIILGNTYHLMLRPGCELIAEMGGLHKFMNWQKPILTDSGGFQIFSLAQAKQGGKGSSGPLIKIKDDSVTFRSIIDGSRHHITPESCMMIQRKIGADFIMAFDQCPPGKSNEDDVRIAMRRTSQWLKRCIPVAEESANQRLIGIIQGGIYPHLRAEHAQEVCEQDLFAFAIGGLSVGEEKEDMWRALAATTEHMPKNKPRYLMGVGTPDDLLDGIALGVDMFDCVMPTRNARNGCLFVESGKLLIKQACYKNDPAPLDEKCSCYTCKNFSRSYLRHLFISQELLFYRLASLHNITHYLRLVTDARQAIKEGIFSEFYKLKKEKTIG